ncbi:hypothetical protein JCM24511_03126 [Saitozyma sp. JCM 24511]|nr:hypothetical protein JCM24511_03126 [Saitozyma sp. JCM 24511]
MENHNETPSAVDHTTGPEENFWQLSERWEKYRLESNPDWIPPADHGFRMVTGTHTGSKDGEFHVYEPGLIFEEYSDGSSAYGPAVGPCPEDGLLVQGDWVGYYLDASMTQRVMRYGMNFREGIETAILERIGPLEAQGSGEGTEADDILENIQRERLDIVNQRLQGLTLEDEESGNTPAQDVDGDLDSDGSVSASGIATPTTSVAPTSLGQRTPSTTTASRSGTTIMTPSTATDSTWRPSVVGENDSVAGGKSARSAGSSQLWGGKTMNMVHIGRGGSFIHLGGGSYDRRVAAGRSTESTEGGEAVNDTA